MESNKILQADVLDIIFEQKNKQYGAYELRKNYHKRARSAVMIVATIAFVISSIPLIAGLLSDDDIVVKRPEIPVPFDPYIPPVPPPVLPPTTPPVTNPTTTVVNTIPIITPADSIIDDKPAEPSNANPGPANNEGPEGPVALNPGPGTPHPGEPVVETLPPKENTREAIELDQMPEFPGGEDAMLTFLKNNLKYPKRAQEEGENGKVVVEFVVDKDGKISEIDFLRKAGYGFDDEAKRVMSLMPDWRPGKINGQPVKAKYQIPIVFEIED